MADDSAPRRLVVAVPVVRPGFALDPFPPRRRVLARLFLPEALGFGGGGMLRGAAGLPFVLGTVAAGAVAVVAAGADGVVPPRRAGGAAGAGGVPSSFSACRGLRGGCPSGDCYR